MARKIYPVVSVLLVVAAFLSVLPSHFCQQSVCSEATQCGDCIKIDPSCAWCEEHYYNTSRCDSWMNLTSKGCDRFSYPKGSLNITMATPLTDADESPNGQPVLITPQEVRVTLKVGEPQTVPIVVQLVEDYPLDLYYLMDLSGSLRDDLTNLGLLGVNLETELKKLTQDLQLGFGSFVDKTTLPFTIDQEICEKDTCCNDCINRFSFRNELPLTKDTGRFAERVSRLNVSTSLDTPEGGLDALIQVAACKEQIGWRDRSRRIIVYATDAGFHMAGDGKLAGISSPNDGLCHVDPVTNEYQKSADQDFPSIGQVKALLENNNLIPVFAVVNDLNDLYQELSRIMTGAKLGILSSDSTNAASLVTTAYREIISEVNIVDTAPENIKVTYTSYCFGQAPMPGSSRCTDLTLPQSVEFNITIMATDCPTDGGPQTFTVRPFGFDESLTIITDFICACDCESKGDPTRCSNGKGTEICGECLCNEGWEGVDCEYDVDSSSCIRPEQYSTNPSVCQRRGQCLGGECICDNHTRSEDVLIFGKYCECDNSCDHFQKKPCGGEERGECICDMKTLDRECRCKPGYTGSACECLTSNECVTISGLICNGWGNCTCEGKCRCDISSPFSGKNCEECPTCVGKCSSFQDCVLCQVFEKGPFTKEQCDMCAPTIIKVEDLNGTDAILCEYSDDDDCTIRYTYYELQEDGTYLVLVESAKVCRNLGYAGAVKQVQWGWILIAIIAGILLVGILIIALIKLGIYFQERRQYAELIDNERKGASSNEYQLNIANTVDVGDTAAVQVPNLASTDNVNQTFAEVTASVEDEESRKESEGGIVESEKGLPDA